MPIFLSVLLIFSSCTSITSKVEELASAPILRPDQKEIVSSLKKIAGESITLKYPAKGDNTSPFLSADLDLDGEDEVIAFYQGSSEGKIQVAMLDKTDGKWNCIYSVSGEGNSILKTDFIKFTGVGEKDIVVGFTDSSGKGRLIIYRAETGEVIGNVPFMDYDIISYGAGINDRLVVVDLVESSATKTLRQKVSYYQYLSGKAQEFVSYEEDTVKKTYQQIECIVRPDFSALVYLDVIIGNEVATEVLKIEGSLIQPILERGYTRAIRIYCRDINEDGIPEIPREIPYKVSEGAEENAVSGIVLPIRWSTINGGSIEELYDSIINTSFGYYIDIPKEWRDKILFVQNSTGNLLTAYIYTGNLNTLGTELYSVKAVYRYEESPEGYTKIGESQSVYYYAKINSSAADIDNTLEITYDALSSSLKLL